MVRWFVVILGWVVLGAGEPEALYLTWVDDPTTSMTVVWHGGEGKRVMYHPFGDARWRAVTAEGTEVPETGVKVYVSHIEGLESDATYVFKVEGSRREFKFRTLPKELSREVRLVIGGDVFYYWGSEMLERMNRAVAFDDPDFVVLGGDLAYTTGSKRVKKGRQWEMDRWQEFFRVMQRSMVRKDGRMIPMVPVVGNHDVHRRGVEKRYGEIFYDLFPMAKKGTAYRKMGVGNYLSLVLLDTGHTSPIEGAQTEWLKEVLEGDEAPYLFSVYHVGAYPSVYKFKGEAPEKIRACWSPLFEKAQVSGAFEHHSHALKRTVPIRGVVYFGDGSWGVPPRHVHTKEELWYLAMSECVNACWFIHLTKKGAEIEARTPAGEVKDRLRIDSRMKVAK